MTKQYIRNIPEYIDELPKDVIEIKQYPSSFLSIFNRYWFDSKNIRVIMKLKKPVKGNKYKVVKPINNRSNRRFIFMYDINDKMIWVDYDYLIKNYSNELNNINLF